jgi:protein-tyrosine phosphatase
VIEERRIIGLQGAWNFRDLGGYGTAAGRRVRWGRLYRSDALHSLFDCDLELLTSLRLRSVIDLRHSNEARRSPDRLPTSVAYRFSFPMGDGIEGQTLQEDVLEGALRDVGVLEIGDCYVNILETYAQQFGRVVETLARSEIYPVVIHCVSGKDRTGLVSALLLTVVGVSVQDVLADFELGNLLWTTRWQQLTNARLASHGIDFQAVQPAFIALRDALVFAFDYINRGYGSVLNYLVRRAGASHAALASVNDVLLE